MFSSYLGYYLDLYHSLISPQSVCQKVYAPSTWHNLSQLWVSFCRALFMWYFMTLAVKMYSEGRAWFNEIWCEQALCLLLWEHAIISFKKRVSWSNSIIKINKLSLFRSRSYDKVIMSLQSYATDIKFGVYFYCYYWWHFFFSCSTIDVHYKITFQCRQTVDIASMNLVLFCNDYIEK